MELENKRVGGIIVKETLIKLAKGLVLGALAGAIVYMIFKDTAAVAVIVLIMIMSMFIQPKQR